jgi:hypothetical protein
LYRQAIGQLANWTRKLGRKDSLGLLIEELSLIEYLGFAAECWRQQKVKA